MKTAISGMDNRKEEKEKYRTRIKFKTTERMTKLGDGKACCHIMG